MDEAEFRDELLVELKDMKEKLRHIWDSVEASDATMDKLLKIATEIKAPLLDYLRVRARVAEYELENHIKREALENQLKEGK